MENNCPHSCSPLIGNSSEISRIRKRIDAAADRQPNMLITGERGAGKEVVVQNLYCRSSRNGKPFVRINCADLTDDVLEKEMFRSGTDNSVYEGQKGEGDSELNGCEALFLDQVDALSLPLQEKLLDFLHRHRYVPGDHKTGDESDTWIMAAACQDLEENVSNGLFREDLFRLFSHVKINMPPLRDRPEDIPLLMEYYVKKNLSGTADDEQPANNCFSMPGPQSMEKLTAYPWPGNVRELLEFVKKDMVANDREASRTASLEKGNSFPFEYTECRPENNKMSLKAMIIDDEPFVRDDLRYMLSAHQEIEVAWEAGRMDEARELLSENRPDIVFLDVQLRGGSGIDLLPDIDPSTRIIFVTAHEESVKQAIFQDAIDCISKPVTADRLADSLNKLLKKFRRLRR